ncbi:MULTISPECIES: hypothetical protein [unclassified Bradyrhizobium]|uniref:hypothetical protein n=1 Tax=unclassified Bradyrhizobium TaxID=2631580 RepID=UPI001CD1B0E7|nr:MULTISPECIES: hypothetical protein [unclassified Bradyrhizobium]MCA1375887.1 hypothetical protein [Bradyrhizobium sp. IC4060]MCA1383902.1 hypothetical protein [Bradyrhizobium sp. BRP05]MCA1418140.1 hypothetical protein [Bradyrhizobium sp. BRP23]MCA1489036.1 hypothetical protein [Bradyrhizobium sp. IC4061]
MFGFTCMPLCKFFVATFRTVDRGCPAGTRSSLRPLSIMRVSEKQSSGEKCREDAEACLQAKCELKNGAAHHTLRHCERSEAIQECIRGRFWIASLRSQ